MFGRSGAAVVVVLGLWAGPALAQEGAVKNLRLDNVPAFAVDRGGPDGDTQLVHRRFWFGYRPFYGYSSFYYGYRPFYYGYRPFYYGFYPRGFSFSFNFYRPYYYQPYYYYAPPVYYYYGPSYCWPISLGLETRYGGTAGSYYGPPARPPAGTDPRRPAEPAPDDGPYEYDGGPADPVPMPRSEPAPKRKPAPRALPSGGRIVSLPAPPARFAYPAYGEKAPPTSFAQDRPAVLKRDPVKAARR